MSMINIKKQNGFSLLEVMLVILIMTTVAIFILRMQGPKFRETQANRAASQMKQVMEAATSYYIDNGHWPWAPGFKPTTGSPFPALSPNTVDTLVSVTGAGNSAYLPKNILNASNELMSPFNAPYLAGPNPKQIYQGDNTSATYFEVQVDTKDPQTAIMLKGRLPLSYISAGKDGKQTVVTAYVNIPSYDYNHAKTVSNVGIYHPGDCIPKPAYACPNGMQPATFVTLEQGYGYATPVSSSSASNDDTTVYPITGSSAYIIPANGSSTGTCPNILSDATVTENGKTTEANPTCPSGEDRVCVDIRTSNGQVTFDTVRLSRTYVLAMSKCVTSNTQE